MEVEGIIDATLFDAAVPLALPFDPIFQGNMTLQSNIAFHVVEMCTCIYVGQKCKSLVVLLSVPVPACQPEFGIGCVIHGRVESVDSFAGLGQCGIRLPLLIRNRIQGVKSGFMDTEGLKLMQVIHVTHLF